MESLITKEIKSKEVWENFVLSQDPKSFLQSWNWSETERLLGKKIFRLGFFKNDNLIGVCLIIKEEAKRGNHFLIPGGPFINWQDRLLVKFFLKTIKDYARSEKVWFVRLRPELVDTPENRKLFKNFGFFPSPMHLHAENTWVLNLSQGEESIMRNMRKSTRYLVRKSLNSGLEFAETVEPNNSKILDRLQEETIERHKFVGFSEELFKAQLETFGRDNQAKLYLCKKGKSILAAAIIIFYGDYAYYHHSGSTSKLREIPFSYFLQWRIIQEAIKRKLKYYNFWGIAPSDSSRHRFAGVTLFKKGFGGGEINWLHAQDLPISLFYFLTYLFETGRRLMRRL